MTPAVVHALAWQSPPLLGACNQQPGEPEKLARKSLKLAIIALYFATSVCTWKSSRNAFQASFRNDRRIPLLVGTGMAWMFRQRAAVRSSAVPAHQFPSASGGSLLASAPTPSRAVCDDGQLRATALGNRGWNDSCHCWFNQHACSGLPLRCLIAAAMPTQDTPVVENS